MSRYAEIPITVVLAAADRWKQECLVEQRSLFEPERRVWRPEVFAELGQRFIGAPDDGRDSFITKLFREPTDSVCTTATESLARLRTVRLRRILPHAQGSHGGTYCE